MITKQPCHKSRKHDRAKYISHHAIVLTATICRIASGREIDYLHAFFGNMMIKKFLVILLLTSATFPPLIMAHEGEPNMAFAWQQGRILVDTQR